MLNEKLGKVNFWMMLIGFNLTFGPMHILGLQGMPRRTYTYKHGYGFDFWNMVSHHRRVHASPSACCCSSSTSSAAAQGQGQASLAIGRARPVGRPQPRVDDPVARRPRTTSTTVPDRHRARRVLAPQVRRGRATAGWCASPPPRTSSRRATRTDVHLPSPSYWPIVLAFGLPFIALRPDLQPVAVRARRRHRRRRHLRLGPRAVDRPRGPPRTTTTTITAPERPRPRSRRRREPPTPTRRLRSLTDTAASHRRGGRRRRRRRRRPGRRTPSHADHAPTPASPTRSWRMWVFLGSECLLFGGLISTYLLYKTPQRRRAGPVAAPSVYDIPFTSVSSFVLLMSSLTMVLAVVGHRSAATTSACALWLAHHRAARRRCSSPARSTSSPRSDARAWASPPTSVGSAFYTLTGFHGVHVTVGIIMLLSLVVLSLRGKLPQRPGRDRRDRRPVLALRRRRLDRDLHRRLPDPK